MTTTYGELQSEKIALENKTTRQIVDEINKFGVNDRQRWMLIYLLGLELENIENMKNVAGFVKDNRPDLFVSSIAKE